MQQALKQTLYERLEQLPEGLTGEILNGQLHTQPRPAGPHALVASNLQIEVGGPFGKGRGGPGGWWIIVEPELHFLRDVEVVVPDIAGWRRERMPRIPEGHRFEVVPDWVCEVLSPSTESKDREIKMPIYAQHGVAHIWLVDPKRRTVETYALNAGTWTVIVKAEGGQILAIPPFDAIRLELGSLWGCRLESSRMDAAPCGLPFHRFGRHRRIDARIRDPCSLTLALRPISCSG